MKDKRTLIKCKELNSVGTAFGVSFIGILNLIFGFIADVKVQRHSDFPDK